MPPSCLRQGRKGSQQNHRRGREASARTSASVSSPLQGAKRQRRHSAGAWPHGPSRGTRAEGARAVIGPSARLRGVRGRTGHAAFLRPAKAGGCTPGMPPSCLRQGRKGLSKATPADVHCRFDQARASARRSRARLAQSEHGRLEMGKCTTTAETRINTGVFIVVQVYKNRRKRTRIEESVQEWGILVHPDNNGKPHKHWVFSKLVHFWISSRGVYKNPVSVLLPGGEASLWRELWKTP